jgi:hypothetical protein
VLKRLSSPDIIFHVLILNVDICVCDEHETRYAIGKETTDGMDAFHYGCGNVNVSFDRKIKL